MGLEMMLSASKCQKDIIAVSGRLGHSNVNMTLQVYMHLIKRNEDEATAYISNSSQNLLNGPLENTKKVLNIGLSKQFGDSYGILK